MKSLKASIERQSVARPAVHDDENQKDVAVSLDLPDKLTPLPSYARPTTCSRRRASAVASASRRTSGTGAAGYRPQSAKDTAHEPNARNSVQYVKHAPRTAQPQSRISSRKSVIAPGSSKPVGCAPASWSASPRRRARDSSAASDQLLQSSRSECQIASSSSVAKCTGSRNTRSSLSSRISTGGRPTSASSPDTAATGAARKPGPRRKLPAVAIAKAAGRPAVKCGYTTPPAAAGPTVAARNTPRAHGSYARSQQKCQVTPPVAAATTAAAPAAAAVIGIRPTSHTAGPAPSAAKLLPAAAAAAKEHMPFASVSVTPEASFSSSRSYAAAAKPASSSCTGSRAPSQPATPRHAVIRTPPAAIAKSKPTGTISNTTRKHLGQLTVKASSSTPRASAIFRPTPGGSSTKYAGHTPRAMPAGASATAAPQVKPIASPRIPAAAIAAKPRSSRTPRAATTGAAVTTAAAAAVQVSKSHFNIAAASVLGQPKMATGATANSSSKGSATVSGVASPRQVLAAAAAAAPVLVTPGDADWPVGGLVPYSITPPAKTASRLDTATPEPQQQQHTHNQYQQQHVKLVPYSVTPISKTASRTAATPQQQQEVKEAVTVSTAAVKGSSSNGNKSTLLHRSGSSSRAPTPRTPRRASEGYAAAATAARRSMAGEGEDTGRGSSTPSSPAATGSVTASLQGTGPSGPSGSSPKAGSMCSVGFSSGLSVGSLNPSVAAAAAGLTVPMEYLPPPPAAAATDARAAAGHRVRAVELPDYAMLEAELAKSPAFRQPAELTPPAGSTGGILARPEAAAAAAITAAQHAAIEAAAAAKALEQELAVEAARLAAKAAAQVAQQQQQQLAQEAAAAAAAAASPVVAATGGDRDRSAVSPAAADAVTAAARSPMPPAAGAAATAAAGVSSRRVRDLVRRASTPECSPRRARTPGRSPASAVHHAELTAKMHDLELTFQQYKVSRDNSPMVRSSMRTGATWQQQQQQPGRHRRCSSQVNISSPSRFWDLSPSAAARAAPAAALASESTVIGTPTAAAVDRAVLSAKDAVKQPAAAAAGMLAQYQELQNKWDAYKERREASPSPLRGSCSQSILASLSPQKPLLEDLAPAAAAMPAAAAAAAATGTSGVGQQGPTTDVGRSPAAAGAHTTDDELALLAAAKLSIKATKDLNLQHHQQQQLSSVRASNANNSKEQPVKIAGARGAAAAARGGVKRSIARFIEGFQNPGSVRLGRKSGSKASAISQTKTTLLLAATQPSATSAASSEKDGNHSSSSSRGRSQAHRASRPSSSGSQAVAAAAAAFAPAALPGSSNLTEAAAAAADTAAGAAAVKVAAAEHCGEVVATSASRGGHMGPWAAAVRWCAPSPDPGSPRNGCQQQQQCGMDSTLKSAAAGPKLPAAAAAVTQADAAGVADPALAVEAHRASLLSGSKPAVTASNSSSSRFESAGNAAAAADPATNSLQDGSPDSPAVWVTGSPILQVPNNSPGITTGNTMHTKLVSGVADELAAWSLDNSCASRSAGAAAAGASTAQSLGSKCATHAAGTTTTACWMLQGSLGTIEGKVPPQAAAAAEDTMQASWLAFNAAAAAAALPAKFRLSGVGAAGQTEGTALAAQPVIAGSSAVAAAAGAGSSGGKGGASRRARKTRAPAAAAEGERDEQQLLPGPTAAEAASPACSEDVFYSPMQFTPGSSTSKKGKVRKTTMTPRSAVPAAAAAAEPSSDSSGMRSTTVAATVAARKAADTFFTPADGFTPGKSVSYTCNTGNTDLQDHISKQRITNSTEQPAAARKAAGGDSKEVCSSSKRQKVQQGAAATGAAAAGSSSIAKDGPISKQLLGLFEAAGAAGRFDQTPGDRPSRKHSQIAQEQQQQQPSAAAGAAEALDAGSMPFAGSGHLVDLSYPGTTATPARGPLPTATPVIRHAPAAAGSSATPAAAAAAYLTAMTPLMRSMGGFGALSSRKLPLLGSGARRVPAAADADSPIAAGAAAQAVDHSAATRATAHMCHNDANNTHNIPRRSARIAKGAPAARAAETAAAAVAQVNGNPALDTSSGGFFNMYAHDQEADCSLPDGGSLQLTEVSVNHRGDGLKSEGVATAHTGLAGAPGPGIARWDSAELEVAELAVVAADRQPAVAANKTATLAAAAVLSTALAGVWNDQPGGDIDELGFDDTDTHAESSVGDPSRSALDAGGVQLVIDESYVTARRRR